MILTIRQTLRHASLALRVALLTTAVVAVTFGLLSSMIYLAARAELERSMDDSMIRRTTAAVHSGLDITAIQDNQLAVSLADMEIGFVRSGQLFEAATPADQTRILRHVAGLPEIEVSLGRQPTTARTVRWDGTRYRLVAVPAGGGTALVMLQSLEPIDETLDRLGFILLLTGAAGVLAAGMVGWIVATNGLRPVRRLTAAAELVARTTELRPIEIRGRDELARLGTAFNHMLTALGAAQERERQLVADAGHELRTPLTSLRTNIELLTQASRSGRDLAQREREEILADVRAQIEELSTLVGDLVELARDEPMSEVPEALNLRDVLEAALERVRRRAPGLTFAVEAAPWMVVGEPRTLERALTNLLDNAAKWSPANGTVSVRLDDGAVTITDEGPGIAAADLPHVFDRFYRALDARTMPGSGLGLSIVRRAAERHGGSVDVVSTPGEGATFTFRLPGESLSEQADPGDSSPDHTDVSDESQ